MDSWVLPAAGADQRFIIILEIVKWFGLVRVDRVCWLTLVAFAVSVINSVKVRCFADEFVCDRYVFPGAAREVAEKELDNVGGEAVWRGSR